MVSYLSQFCYEREWYNNVIVLVRLTERKGLVNTLLESRALMHKKQYIKAAHNILGPKEPVKMAIPYYMVAHAFEMAGEVAKQKQALKMARSYDLADEKQIAICSDYLKNTGLHNYHLESLRKLGLLGSSMSSIRINSFNELDEYHSVNSEFDTSYKYFLNYYTRVCSSPLELGVSPAMAFRLSYKHCEYQLRMHIKNKNSDAAIKVLDECLRLYPNNIELAIILQESTLPELQKRFKTILAKQWSVLQKQIKIYPHNSLILNSAAWLGALCNHQLESCLKYALSGIEAEPSAAIYDTLAEVLFRLKRYKEAVFYIEKSTKMDKIEPFYKKRLLQFREVLKNKK